ncbi:GntR family transcriptional regulator [Jiella marina]|uniref:GntR family transcriptional regulator n=1 Tax=Jiella sp. LLJ827 TaxID=2917712 RepID=UPI002100E77B|nr:GntR family transcriptional regulator [Jiella sp. LLJ827]MCQ0988759.1 GntR family transcriptional regulator [Jiella sp. LLJ827]
MSEGTTLSLDAATGTPPSILHIQVIDDLRGIITRGELAEGKRVPEAALCERLGVSRTPLREALKVLAAEGFVELRPNRGAVVVPIDSDAVAALFELKGAIEYMIGLKLPERITPAERAHIEAIQRRLVECQKRADASGYTLENHNFHAALAAGIRNDAVVQTYSTLQRKILRARLAINEDPSQLARSVDEHEGILTMLRAGAARDLAFRLEKHNRRTGEAILAQLRAKRA